MGETLVVLGAWSFIEMNNYHQLTALNTYTVIFGMSVAIIILGGILIVVACFGCLGALRENICLLKTVSSQLYQKSYSFFFFFFFCQLSCVFKG